MGSLHIVFPVSLLRVRVVNGWLTALEDLILLACVRFFSITACQSELRGIHSVLAAEPPPAQIS